MERGGFPLTIGFYHLTLIMDNLIDNIQEEEPWCLFFVDNKVLVDE